MVPAKRLNNGVEMPSLGFGVYKIPDDEVEQVVRTAIEAGYRSIDTATLYRNERGVGAAVRSCGLPREELFVTTKLWNTEHGYDRALKAFEGSLAQLGLDYVDLYLIHWPQPSRDLYVETWRALEKILADGRARAIGVSNFQVPHLQRLLDETDVVPAVDQVELHPALQQPELRKFDADHGIVTEAWSPLARGGLLSHQVITTIARKHGKTPAQVVLRWHIEMDLVAIPKSATPERIRENIDIFDFELDAQDVAALATLESGDRQGPHPDEG
ncbi:diketogulonate reductase-like aldo/keto reductase [Amycolatopsis bartoniae]|uniref:Oxidoreductase n=1 Tax=Amycolatopsis bartoniae TaxID=941986 RepID=A0A8H9IXC6_9PSEU|nr:aldo/keto reductase [Amycolatopsis bartoniae]MBB2939069.1 diketogulonate reductase-like aldo/keto reductase [Amycolatopsis bartoniae]TVT06329.1 aldo/keto reductase [Amycolatopsis bartoniae]GHF65155.1 oxidoreductase [Amycolatopsis bartoniae]